jgi:hypothetical protein
MRILITREGKEAVEDIENTTDINQYSNRRAHSKNITQTQFSPHKYNIFHRNRSSNPYQTFSTFQEINHMSMRKKIMFDPELQTPTSNDIKNAKFHKLSNHKVTVSKSMTSKYDNTEATSNIISVNNNIPSFLLKGNEDSINSYSSRNNIKVFSFNEIIPNKTVTNMKIKMIRDKKMKDKLSKIDENNFRSTYEEKTDIEKLDDLLSYPKINCTKIGLIKYLNNDKKITPYYLRKVVKSNPVQINRMNKLAQILINQEEKQKLQSNLIENKIENSKNEEKILINQQMDTMKRQMQGFKDKLDKYKTKINKKERYRDLFNDVLIHYWGKYDYDKLNKKGTPRNKYTYSLFSSYSKLPDYNK